MDEVDEVIIHGYLGAWWGVGDDGIANITAKIGKPPIYQEMSKEGAQNCDDSGSGPNSTCPGISMIDLMEENYELAQYLNFDIPSSIEDDNVALCTAAENFRVNMKTAHDNGVRLMAAYLTTGTSYFADPTADSVLRMFEELGMPIIHPGKSTLCLILLK